MTIEAEIFTRLTTFGPLTALIGTRVSPGIVPQNEEMPAVSYRRITAPRVSAMGVDTGLVRATFQVDCWSSEHVDGTEGNFDEARAVGDQVVKALNRFRTTTGTIVQDSFVTRDLDMPPEEDGKTFHVETEFEIWFEE